MTRRYDASEIEPKWQRVWEDEDLYRASEDPADPRPRFYALDMFPYPSGDLHMGHAEAFSGGDVIARYRTMRGYNVLHPIGWDAFGLPAENAAIKRGAEPRAWTDQNIEQQAASFRRMGMSFDWSRRLATCDPEYYRWTQWLFLRFFEKGLAYRKSAPVNWCPQDQTVLANEQVIQGACERCGTMVERRELTQWFYKITEYAQRLLDDMDDMVEWPERVLTMQRNWIGRSEGARVTFTIAETGEEIEVFTTRPDTLWGVTFFVFSIEHPAVRRLAELGGTLDQVEPLFEQARTTVRTYGQEADTKHGVFLGVHAVNPVNGEQIPVYAAPYVLMEYGTGAIMAVPAHDERDFAFARQHDVPVRPVIQPEDAEPLDGDSMTEAYPGEGVMVNSGPFDGHRTPASIADVAAWLEEEGRGHATVNFRIRDWLQSRQRSWGAPIPIVYCPTCGEVAVPDEDLPVQLPDDLDFSLGGGVAARAPPHLEARSLPDLRRRGGTRHGHDGHVRRLQLVLLPLLLARLRGRPVPSRGRRAMDAGRPVHGRGRARDPASALLAVLHEGAVRHGDGRVHRAVPEAHEPGPGDLRRRVDEQVEREHRRADAARRAVGRRHDAPDHAVRRAVRGRHRLEADRGGRSEPASGRALVAGPGVRRWSTRRSTEERRRTSPESLVRLTHRTIEGVTDDMERFRLQHGDLEDAGADERDAYGAGRRWGRPRRGAGVRSAARAVRPLRGGGAVARGAGRRRRPCTVDVARVRPGARGRRTRSRW